LWTAGFAPVTPQGAYYVVADARGVGYDDAVTLCRRLPERAGIVAIPVTAFATPGGQTARELASWVRFTFVKSPPLLREAARRLAALRR
jgi:N-succinyldiaminopimelate aminotransferase